MYIDTVLAVSFANTLFDIRYPIEFISITSANVLRWIFESLNFKVSKQTNAIFKRQMHFKV